MDYKKKYKAALDWMRDVYPTLEGAAKEDAEHYFPELAESEDERIRKEILDFCKNRAEKYSNDPKYKNISAWIAWLEKQGGKELVTCPICGWEIEKQGRQKPADKVKTKFKVGDEIKTINEVSLIITRIDRWGYWSEDLFICNFDDADKWELVKQNPWSEEDEGFLCKCLGALGNPNYCYEDGELECMRNWLKSLRPKSQWKPSEEQIMAIDTAINVLGKGTLNGKQLIELYQDLKKLKGE